MIDAETRLRLEDMLEYARLATAILGAADAVALTHNPEKRLAVVRAVEVIGEAANAIGDDQRAALAPLPWSQMIAMRHRLIHGYGSIDLNILVDTVRSHVTPLIAELERILNTGAQGQP